MSPSKNPQIKSGVPTVVEPSLKWSEKEFTRLIKDPSNKKIGNFLSVFTEANPEWYWFYDKYGNMVQFGNAGCSTDIYIHIKEVCRPELESRLLKYMNTLLGRHGEKLHRSGTRRFKNVIIKLPYEYELIGSTKDVDVTIHTGSGTMYDQDEIAYEVMAALSGLPTLKVVPPFGTFSGFDRQDTAEDGLWINYYSQALGIRVMFNHIDDGSGVIVSLYRHWPREDWDYFKKIMYDFSSEYVKAYTEQDIVRETGRKKYQHLYHKDIFVFMDISSGSSYCFSFSASGDSTNYLDKIRLAKDIMETLKDAFKEFHSKKKVVTS